MKVEKIAKKLLFRHIYIFLGIGKLTLLGLEIRVSRFMPLPCPIVRVLRIIMNNIWHQFRVSHPITSQFIRHDPPRLSAMGSHQATEETLRSSSVPFSLRIHIKHLAIVVNSSPQVVLLAIDRYKDFVDGEDIGWEPVTFIRIHPSIIPKS